MNVELLLDDAAVQALAERAAEIVLARLAEQRTETWPEWMSVETAARYLDVSAERVRKLVARREVPFYQEGPGCRILLRRSEIDEWMRDYRAGPR